MLDKIAHEKLFYGLKNVIDAYIMLGINKKSPEEFQRLVDQKKMIGELYGWK